jgi:hypothetical protein
VARVKRKLVLLALAGAAVWAIALLDFSARTAPLAPQEQQASSAEQQPALHERRARVPSADQPQDAPEPEAAQAAAPPASSSPLDSVVRAAQGTVAVIGKAVRAVWTRGRSAAPAPAHASSQPPQLRATDELGEGSLSPDYADAEQKFAGEARDGAWAGGQEQRVRALLDPQPWSDRVSLVSCQQSTCRVVIETDAEDPFRQLLGVPGLSDTTGIVSNTPYSLRSGQLSVYFTPSAAPSAEHASN